MANFLRHENFYGCEDTNYPSCLMKLICGMKGLYYAAMKTYIHEMDVSIDSVSASDTLDIPRPLMVCPTIGDRIFMKIIIKPQAIPQVRPGLFINTMFTENAGRMKLGYIFTIDSVF